ncbi:MAG: ATP-dependent Clp protease proteolytic subunit [Oscillospiraceae bacterium]|nr:ATP-dependent Clp protease proteolytic subunit [Candidatus Limimonas egerieequi]
MSNNRGYYDIELDLDQLLLNSADIDAAFYLQDLKQRKLYFNSDVEQSSVHEIVKHILQINKEDMGVPVELRQPIRLYVVSYGGEVDSGFELIDIIRNSKTPVYTINLGYQYSMGFFIGLAGHKRYATPNAKFLLHDGSSFVYNSTAKVKDQIEFQNKMEDRLKEYVLERTNITEEEYTDKFRVEWYLFADEAKEKGCVDYIIGEDCDIEEIL